MTEDVHYYIRNTANMETITPNIYSDSRSFVILRLCVQNNTVHPYISIWQVLAVMFKNDSLS